MDYSEAYIKLEQSMKVLHEAILKRDPNRIDLESDNIIFLARQLRDSIDSCNWN
jgi:hypothetical protein